MFSYDIKIRFFQKRQIYNSRIPNAINHLESSSHACGQIQLIGGNLITNLKNTYGAMDAIENLVAKATTPIMSMTSFCKLITQQFPNFYFNKRISNGTHSCAFGCSAFSESIVAMTSSVCGRLVCLRRIIILYILPLVKQETILNVSPA